MPRYNVSGTVVLLTPPGTGAVGATIEIVDLDSGGDGDDRIFGPFVITNANGSFSGMTNNWDDRNTETATALGVTVTVDRPDVPLFQIVIRQGAFVAVFPAPALLNPFPPLVVTWGQDFLTGTPDRRNPVVKAWCKARVGDSQQRYQWSTYGFEPFGYCQRVPADALPPPIFVTERGIAVARGKTNKIATDAAFLGQTFGNSLSDFDQLYPSLPGPPKAMSRTYKNDAEFVAQRFIGPNPMMIARVTSLPADFPVNDAHVQQAFPGLTLSQALNGNRVFLLDYSILANIQRTNGSRYLPAPYALFIATSNRAELLPVAIQIERNFHAIQNPIYTPHSPPKHWQRAKLMVQVADGSAHELRYHLFNAHMTMEATAVAMQRNLCPLHPLKQLIDRHLHGLLVTNQTARSELINDGGPVDRLIGTGLAGSKIILQQAHKLWRFSSAGLPDDLAARGLDNPATSLKSVPLRDDGMLVWAAIEKYINDYVLIDYPTDNSVGSDDELQAWVKEIGKVGKGGLLGVPAVNSKPVLVKFLSTIVYTSSAYHSAVNYPQYDYIGYLPNLPGASWARPLPPPRGTDEVLELEFLPPFTESKDQVEVVWGLASYQYDQLGAYRDPITGTLWPFADAQRETAAGKFRKNLKKVGDQIDAANNGRVLKSLRLHPKHVLNSISM